MKNIFSRIILVAFLCASFSQTATAREYIGAKKMARKAVATKDESRCKRAQSTAELNINNVRALINAYGNMWFDGAIAKYYIPANGSSTPMYCAALWIGGTDVNDQLRIAALKFGSSGDDYWPGPLTVDGQATVSLDVCNEYDRHYKITQAEVQTFRGMFDYSEDGAPMPNEKYDEGLIPDVIKEWPAHGNTSKNQSRYLAPFFDADGDGEYDYTKGDYPYYDFDNELCPKTLKANLAPGEKYEPARSMEQTNGTGGAQQITGSILSDQVLKGDQTIWWVFNDNGNSHTESSGQAIGLEIRAQAFAFSTNDEINNMTFYTYEIINRSTYELANTYFSQWVDPDLGYAHDDFVGCDVKRGLGYCYNGKDQDGSGTAETYSGNPPAVGIDFFQGPYMDPDGSDNPKIDIEKAKNYPEYSKYLQNYWLEDKECYDTIQLSEDAELFYDNETGGVWYFKPGETVNNCAINGVNFGNGIVDDERFGMRRFVYYNNASGDNGEPEKAYDYYNYLTGVWKNKTRMRFGGDGINAAGTTEIGTDFMFPGDSDPWNWGTDGTPAPFEWTEKNTDGNGASNTAGDRRFMQSAGPFTLKPGAVNYITVGIPFAQAASGGPSASVALLRQIDDKCQSLFENCFKIIDGPDAPTLVAHELENEVILYLTYDNPNSNNYNEKYNEQDPSIARFSSNLVTVTDTVRGADGNPLTDINGNIVVTTRQETENIPYSDEERSFKFEGYQIYQLKDATVSVTDLGDETKARLVAQCDIENYYDDAKTLPIGKLVNYEMNGSIGALVPSVKVSGANKGIQHSFRIANDAFATGNNTRLVNNKEYYFIAIAYAHNRYKAYDPTDAGKLDGQKTPYLAGRKNEKQGSIEAIKVMPHDPSNENGGTIIQAAYGTSPEITRIEGFGNGNNVLRLTESSIEELMGAPGQEPTHHAASMEANGVNDPWIITHPRYEKNYGPLSIRIVDPLNVKPGEFIIKFSGVDSAATWVVTRKDGEAIYDDVYEIKSEHPIARYNEQLILDLGISICLSNATSVATDFDFTEITISKAYGGGYINDGTFLGANMQFDDVTKMWLTGLPDNDNYITYNWIRAGSQYVYDNRLKFLGETGAVQLSTGGYLDEDYYKAIEVPGRDVPETYPLDKNETFEKVLQSSSASNGTWAPYALISTLDYHPGFSLRYFMAEKTSFVYGPRTTGMPPYVGPEGGHNFAGETYDEVYRSYYDPATNTSLSFNDMRNLSSIRVVITNDKSKWTRCPVIEMSDDYSQSEGNARKFQLRKAPSVDKEGNPTTYTWEIKDKGRTVTVVADSGMGWFPGYVINIETGERLNIMFGEDSRYPSENGKDMLWNPTATTMLGSSDYVMGGRHFLYILGANNQLFKDLSNKNGVIVPTNYKTPSYDEGRWAWRMLSSLNCLLKFKSSGDTGDPKNDYRGAAYNGLLTREESSKVVPERDSSSLLFSSVMWVNMPLATSKEFVFTSYDEIPCDVTIDINVSKPYSKFYSHNESKPAHSGVEELNANNPMYEFELTSDVITLTDQYENNEDLTNSILDNIAVVPNPYYSNSAYETSSQLDTRVRITNLPANSTVSIYTVDGTLVRRLGPSPSDAGNANTGYTLDWDLKTHTGLPISGGMYLIHVKTPMGERIVKWFGTMRPVDLNAFQF